MASEIQYEPLKQQERSQSVDCDDKQPPKEDSTWKSCALRLSRLAYVPCTLHLLLIAGYSVLFISLSTKNLRSCSPCFSEKLLGAPIIWEDKTYTSNIHSNVFDPYSRDNPNVDEAWKALVDTHITTISEEEKQKLPGGRFTARAYGGEDGYAVLIEVFHQLHCLNSIRIGYYQGNNSEANSGFADPGGHSDHCFSYLAQTLMCHADVGAMTTTWRETAQVFTADFNVTKQCRNFDAILEWAQGRKAKFHPPKGVTQS